MKLMASRPYRHDLSDAAQIVYEYNQTHSTPMSIEKVKDAIWNLYEDMNEISDDALDFLEKMFETSDLNALIEKRIEIEKQNRETLNKFENDYPDTLNGENIESILKNLSESYFLDDPDAPDI